MSGSATPSSPGGDRRRGLRQPAPLGAARSRLASLRLLPPRAIFTELERLGYRGQDDARRAASLFAYRHVRRLQRLLLEGLDRRELPHKTNLLLIGPTGCGKTFLFELLFGQIFPLPHVVVDVTRFTETGYVGRNVVSILTQLLGVADESVELAQIGAIALDEIDKLALESSSARYAGEGTTKDVKGNVQKELLQIVGGADVAVPMRYETDFGPDIAMSTRDIGFVAAGAFSGIAELEARRHGRKIGFHTAGAAEDGPAGPPEQDAPLQDDAGLPQRAQAAGRTRAAAAAPTPPRRDEPPAIDVDVLQDYGFLPEFTARFGRMVRLHALTRDDLRRILDDNIIPPLRREFDLEGVPLALAPDDLEHFVDHALELKTGARGLRAAVERHVEQLAFERFGASPPAGRRSGRRPVR